MKDKEAKRCQNKPTTTIKAGSSRPFNGGMLTQKGSSLTMNHPVHIKKIKILDPETLTKAAYVSKIQGRMHLNNVENRCSLPIIEVCINSRTRK